MCIATLHCFTLQLVVVIATALTLGCASDHQPAPGRGFYAEVAVQAEAHLGDPLVRFGNGGGLGLIRWWYAPDPDRWRWEFETAGTVIDNGVLLTVAAGDDSWEYDDRTNVYRRGVLAGFPDEVVVLLRRPPPVTCCAASSDTRLSTVTVSGAPPMISSASSSAASPAVGDEPSWARARCASEVSRSCAAGLSMRASRRGPTTPSATSSSSRRRANGSTSR